MRKFAVAAIGMLLVLGTGCEVPGTCVPQGCSGEVCSDKSGLMTTCEVREEYACIKQQTCGRLASGECGWTPTEASRQCFDSLKANPGQAQ